MMDKDTLTMNLQREMKIILDNEGINRKGVSIYLFGSAKYKKEYADIDLLVTYKDINYVRMLRLRQIMCRQLEGIFKKKIDVTLLTDSEAQDTNFIVEEDCELVFF